VPNSPVLVIHSRGDSVIPFWHGQKIFALANEPKHEPVVAAGAALLANIASIEEELIQVKMATSGDALRYPGRLHEQLAYLAMLLEDNSAPTAAQREVATLLHERLVVQLARWQAMLQKDIPALNDLLRVYGVPQLDGAAAP